MIGELSLGAALLMGAAGSPHCMAMCGAISAAFGLSAAREHPIAVPLCASVGRVLGYAALGGLVGSLGLGASAWLQQPAGIVVLRVLAALTLALVGLQLAGFWQPLDQIARIGAPLWRRLQPLSRRLLPIDTPAKALAFGLLWGLLPCGLVYGMLALTIGFASPVQSALFMGAFGLGTLPAMLGLAAAASAGRGIMQPRWRIPVGWFLLIFAVFFLLAPYVLPHSGPLAQLRPWMDC